MKKKKVDLVKQAAIARQDLARMEQMSQATGYGSRKPHNEVNQSVARPAGKVTKER
jgi:hypothetical protein